MNMFIQLRRVVVRLYVFDNERLNICLFEWLKQSPKWDSSKKSSKRTSSGLPFLQISASAYRASIFGSLSLTASIKTTSTWLMECTRSWRSTKAEGNWTRSRTMRSRGHKMTNTYTLQSRLPGPLLTRSLKRPLNSKNIRTPRITIWSNVTMLLWKIGRNTGSSPRQKD